MTNSEATTDLSLKKTIDSAGSMTPHYPIPLGPSFNFSFYFFQNHFLNKHKTEDDSNLKPHHRICQDPMQIILDQADVVQPESSEVGQDDSDVDDLNQEEAELSDQWPDELAVEEQMNPVTFNLLK